MCCELEKMFKYFIFVLFLVSCTADLPVTPPKQPIICGEIPNSVYSCLGHPKILKPEDTQKCTKGSDCEKIKCIFEKSGWSDKNGKIDKQSIISYFEGYATENPSWAPAVQQVKLNCLTTDLPAQGVFLNCPAYDIVHCTLINFLRNASPSQWSTASNCEYARQYAATCPVCPDDCFAPLVPNDSCHACHLLPRTP